MYVASYAGIVVLYSRKVQQEGGLVNLVNEQLFAELISTKLPSDTNLFS